MDTRRAPKTDRVLVVKAGALLVFARVGMWSLSFLTVQRLLGHLARLTRRPSAIPPPVAGICGAVTAASRFVPHSTCLFQAMAAHALLTESGHDSHVRLGVARNVRGDLIAHAWLEADGEIVLGEATRHEFVELQTSSRGGAR
jgi:hypothetical protein